MGTPTEETWPGVMDLPDYNKVTFKDIEGIPLDQIFLDVDPEAVDLVKKLLLYDASMRLSAEEVRCKKLLYE